MLGDAAEQLVEVAADELPLEGRRALFIADLEVEDALTSSFSESESLGVSTLRCTMEKEISIWSSQLAWTGRWTSTRLG